MIDSSLSTYIEAAAIAVEEARDELCRLDAVAGDGDHGVTMALAARAVRQKVLEKPGADGAELLTSVAMGMASVGGAIGPLYASALMGAAAIVRSWGPDSGPLTVARIRECAEAAETAIVALGHAKPGDKTILDALAPAVDSLRSSECEGATPNAAIAGAARAAEVGASGTALMVATLGRASRLGERSRGSADPGATSLAVILGAIARTSALAPDSDGV